MLTVAVTTHGRRPTEVITSTSTAKPLFLRPQSRAADYCSRLSSSCGASYVSCRRRDYDAPCRQVVVLCRRPLLAQSTTNSKLTTYIQVAGFVGRRVVGTVNVSQRIHETVMVMCRQNRRGAICVSRSAGNAFKMIESRAPSL